MNAPLPLWHGIVLEQMLVGAAASLVNLIIHAVLLGAVVWAVRGLAARDSFVPGFVQYTLVIVATGTLLMAGHFVEVMVWAITYGLVGIAPPRVELIYLAFGNYTTLGYADLVAPEAMAATAPDDGAERHHADRLVDGGDHRDLAPRRAGDGGELRRCHAPNGSGFAGPMTGYGGHPVTTLSDYWIAGSSPAMTPDGLEDQPRLLRAGASFLAAAARFLAARFFAACSPFSP